MPSSTNAGKPMVKKWIESRIQSDDFRILDLGCGRGTYGRLVTKPCYKVAVDVMPYKDKFNLLDFYNEFHQRDIRDYDYLKSLGQFDLAILGDVLEHLYPEEARTLLDSLETHCNSILLGLPYRYWQWGTLNHYENHLQPDLDKKVIMERYSEFTLIKEYTTKEPPWNGGVFYGYWAWERKATL